MKTFWAAAIAAATVVVLPSFASAQPTDTEFYGNVGVANMGTGDLNFETADLRLGYRFTRYIGVEVEGQIGIGDDTVTVNVPPPTDVNVSLDSEVAAYVVGSMPVSDHVRLIARVGYGTQRFGASAGGSSAAGDDESINAGVGGRWLWDQRNGLQLDYTHHEFSDGGDADVFAFTYVRVFN